jgi:hypothetical protein
LVSRFAKTALSFCTAQLPNPSDLRKVKTAGLETLSREERYAILGSARMTAVSKPVEAQGYQPYRSRVRRIHMIAIGAPLTSVTLFIVLSFVSIGEPISKAGGLALLALPCIGWTLPYFLKCPRCRSWFFGGARGLLGDSDPRRPISFKWDCRSCRLSARADPVTAYRSTSF